jgi:hypothetical protein
MVAFAVPGAAAGLADYSGTWTFDPAKSADIPKAIDEALAKENFAIRTMARGRLVKANKVPKFVFIAQANGMTTVSFDEKTGPTAPSDGRTIVWTRPDGRRYQLRIALESGVLVQSYKAEHGTRVNRFTLSPDGRILFMDVTVSSPRLESSIVYRLVFRQDGA